MSQHGHPCDEFTTNVLNCHRIHGRLGEDCVREELAQKKCFAELLCRREAAQFYDDKMIPQFQNNRGIFNYNSRNNTPKVSCSTLVEVFAKPENEFMIPEGVTKDDRKFCRKITHELAQCLSRKRK